MPLTGDYEPSTSDWSRENAEEKAEALRKDGFQDVTVLTIPADLSAAMPGSS